MQLKLHLPMDTKVSPPEKTGNLTTRNTHGLHFALSSLTHLRHLEQERFNTSLRPLCAEPTAAPVLSGVLQPFEVLCTTMPIFTMLRYNI